MKQRVLLTPGPLTTSARVKQAMQVDAGTRDKDYQDIVQNIRHSLLQLAHAKEDNYSCVLLQGSGTYGVESVLTSTIRKDQKLLILANGSYGQRMEQICKKANVPY
ncbi:MAG: 2-aminoethylphosphonate--pyruvate transaminase, partial [Longicatena sp.]